MPTYDYACSCGAHESRRRLFSEREEPLPCECGGNMAPQFTPNGNSFVPMRHTSLNGITWSDVHGDVTEKELAKDPNVEKYDYYASQSGNGRKRRKKLAPEERVPVGSMAVERT